MFTEEVRIKKASIKDVCTGGEQLLVKGDYTLNGQRFADGTLMFCGFRGVKVAKNVWGGAYHFDTAGSETPEKWITVAELSKALAPSAAPKIQEKK